MNTRIPSSRPLRGWKWSRLVPLLLLSGGLAPMVPQAAYAQVAGAHTVTGKITSDNGEGIPGVTVVVKGTTVGATTDVNGNYTVSVPDDSSILVFSSVGFAKQEIAVGKRTSLSPTLAPETQALNEVQVVGYGTQKKSQVTGAISTVSDEQLRDVPVANVGQALQGRAAGITVSSSSTTPGQAPVIRIRGNRSISGSNDPLLVVDGVPYDGSLNDLNPDDITSLEVLKDASSTAIYGARGANGVILITTRHGKSGAPRATYSGYAGQKRIYGRYNLQDGQQYYNYKLEAYRAQNANYDPATPTFLTADERANYAAGKTTDYQSLLFQHGHTQNHVLGVSGGTDQTQYSASLGYYDETGIVPVQRFQRYSLRATLDQQIGKRIKVGVNTLNTYTVADDPDINILYQILTTSPLASAYDANGLPVLFPNTDTAGSNPLTLYTQDAHKDQNRRLRTFNSLYGQVNILKGLDYRLNLGLDARSENNGQFYASNTPQNGGGQSTASRSTNVAFNLLAENLLLYNNTFGKHTVGFTGLYSAQQYNYDGFSTGVRNLPTNYQLDNSLGSGTPSSAASTSQQWDIISYMARVNYSYDNRYSATVTVRSDGSSRLAPGNKYKAFPSAAVAWNIANESFMQGKDWLNTLKLRASLGRVGSTAVNPYQTLGALSAGIGAGYYNYGSTGAIGVVPSSIPNPNLGWEYTTTTNFGLDFGILQNRITGSVEVYQQRTSDLLLPDALPTASGYGSFVRNAGQTQNRGIELSLTTVNVRPKNPDGFEWSTDWNFTVNREKVLDLGLSDANGNKLNDVGNQRFIGQPLYVIYDYKNIGIWQTSEADQAKKYNSKPGQIKVEDTDGNGVINANDRQVIGSRQPKFEAGITNRFRFKGFDLTAVALTRVGATVVDPTLFGPTYFTTNTGRRNQVNLDYWTPTNPSNTYPEPDQTVRATEWPTYGQTLGYRNGTFIKIRSIDLGYTLPAAWAKAAFMSSTRIYIQVQNPLIWAKDPFFKDNKAIDPDALSYSTRLNAGNPGGIEFTGGNPNSGSAGLAGTGTNYPVTRAFIVGVNLGF
ncbi:SusC/RagA family TonB-linked outer membrane protein [Hymenobacter sp. HMF4947]|uniref:SusC/RagA family TonB-linked outer membrane protein n=1 Tax=Hymenobacter ginkgonis TaxID=2682976 RepID=A0A7K1TEK2_9BACT|nr:TonB-dependent receptor [Hymenobacter ginkgonis]MVN76722.1 SusC/RagA family TonB-linked outer membrane protein [Hymenobacter ginkgonis]